MAIGFCAGDASSGEANWTDVDGEAGGGARTDYCPFERSCKVGCRTVSCSNL